MLCGTFGCTLPDSHAGLHQVPPPARARERRPTAKARDDSDSDEQQPAAELSVTALRTRRTQARVPPLIGAQRVQASALPARITRPAGGVRKRRLCDTKRRQCEHGRQRSRCKECGGAGLCEHGRVRSECKECGGASVCEHGKRRRECKECGGAGVCEHGRQRSRCKQCGGKGICEHGRQRPQCKECGGKGICEHGRRRTRCKECVVLAMADDDGGLFDFLDVMSDFDVEIGV
jgi:hypothetical protein